MEPVCALDDVTMVIDLATDMNIAAMAPALSHRGGDRAVMSQVDILGANANVAGVAKPGTGRRDHRFIR